MTLAFYMDVHIPGAVTQGLRQRGVDVLTSQEDATDRLDDDLLLQRATALGRVVYSNDQDFPALVADWTSTGRDFAGVVYACQQRISIGDAVRDLELIAKVLDPEDMKNRIMFIPL